MHHLLLPLDASAFGETALPLAAELAGRQGQALELLTVHAPFPRFEVEPDLAAEIDAQLRTSAGRYLEDLAGQVRRRSGLEVRTSLLEGPVVPTIVSHTLIDPPALIVMSTHGRSGPGRFFLGSVADRLVRELHVPMLLVHPATWLASDECPAVSQVLVPLDGSSPAETVVDEIARLYAPATASLHLMRVVFPVGTTPLSLPATLPQARPDILERRMASAGHYLEDTAKVLRRGGWRVETHVAVDWNAAAAILAYADAHHATIIAIATHGRGGVQRMLLGSVADKLIRGAAVPVLVVNPLPGASSRVLSGSAQAATVEPPTLVGR